MGIVAACVAVMAAVSGLSVATGAERRPSGKSWAAEAATNAVSRVVHRSLTADEALALAEREHGDSLARAPWRPLRLLGGQRVDRHLTDHTARIDRGEGRRASIATSTLPLRIRDRDGAKRPVSLTLERDGSGFTPENPFVDLRLGGAAGDGIALRDLGVHVRPIGIDGDAAGVVRGDKVFYGNAARDTDLVAVALPGGAELYAQLRSPEAPERLTLAVDLPRGARLQEDARSGAVAIVRGGRTLAHLVAPQAWDADNAPVDVRYELRGNRVTIVVDHRDEAHRYPLVVDPAVVESFESWRANASMDYAGWNFEPDTLNKIKAFYGEWYLGRGLYLYNRTATESYAGTEHRRWHFNVLGFGDAYIFKADFTNMVHEPNATCATQGLFSRKNNAYEPGAYKEQCFGYSDFRTNTVCARSDCGPTNTGYTPAATTGNAAMFGVKTPSLGVRPVFTAYVGGASIHQFDTVKPVMAASGIPTTWVESATGIKVRGTDTGMGMSNVRVSSPNKADWDQAPYKEPIPGCYDRKKRCAKIVETDAFGTGNLPEGIVQIRGTGRDIIGDTTITDFPIQLDKSPPTVNVVSGKLFDHRNRLDDHRNEGVYDLDNPLHVEAGDSLSGVKSVEVFVDGVSQASRGGFANGGTLDWTLKADDYGDGPHTIRIEAKDHVHGTPGSTPELHTGVHEFTVVIDRRGDIYRAQQWDGEPGNGGFKLADESAQRGTRNARRVDDESIATRQPASCPSDSNRQCGEVRYRIEADDTDDDGDGPNDSYARYYGTTVEDARLDPVADIQEPSSRDLGQPTRTGPINDAMTAAQHPPPAHGASYELYETDEPENVDDQDARAVHRLWIDATTRMPLREQTLIAGEVETDVFYTYDHDRLERSQAPADEFAVARPDQPASDTTVDYATDPPQEPGEDPNADSEAERTESARHYRREFGLDASDATIRAVLADPSLEPSVYRRGTPLTAAEEAEMNLRARAVEAMSVIDEYGASKAPTSYAGTYIDHQAGGLVYVGFTTLAEVHMTELRKVYPYPDRLRSFQATQTLVQLDALQEQVSTDIPQLIADGFAVQNIVETERRNAVEVGVPQVTPDLSLKLTLRYPGQNVRLVQDAAGAAEQAPTDPQDGSRDRIRRRIPPLAAGLSMSSSRGYCSSAFSVRRGNAFRVITAGHCGPKGRKWYHAGRTLGTTRARAYRDNGCCDTEIVRISRRMATNRVYLGNGRTLRIRRTAPFQAGQIRNRSHEGTELCKVGYRFGPPQCGPLTARDVTSAQCTRVENNRCTGQVLHFRHQHQARYRSRPGDSGGAVYNRATREAYGNHHTAGDAQGDRTFTPIQNIIDRFRVRVVGTDTEATVLDALPSNPTNAQDDTIDENQDARFVVRLNYPSTRDERIDFRTVNGTAVGGQDFVAQTASVTIPAGSTRVAVVVDVTDDTAREGAETFQLELTGGTVPLSTDRTATARIEASD
jgi:hypothetical protein